jgi:hypothetical protein
MPSRKLPRWNTAIHAPLVLATLSAFAAIALAAGEALPQLHKGPSILVLSTFGVSAISIAWTAILLRRREKQALQEAEDDPAETLRRRADRANAALTEAVTLMNDLQREVTSQKTKLLESTEQADELRKFLQINREHAEFLRELTVRDTKAAIQAERREQWKFLLIGAALSIPIGIAINLLF